MATNVTAAPTSWAVAGLSALAAINWGEVINEVQTKSLTGGITTAEHVASAVAGQLATTGNSVAVEANAVLPTAENILGMALSLFPITQTAAAAPAATTSTAASS